jgi:molybdate transport system ATP-binding protein
MGGLHFDCRLRYDSGFELDAAFEAGDGVTALLGPSGGGKSSVLGLIAGTLRPREGCIRLGGRTLVDTGAGVFLAPERRLVGVVFQDHLLFPHLTVHQNLLFGHGRRAARPIDLGRVVEILEIGGLLGRRPEALSGGQRQRVALGRALLRGPELLLMDEPLAALDEGLKGRILGDLERVVAEWRIPTLFVSHDRDDVRRLADRVVMVEGGRVTAAGPTAGTLGGATPTWGEAVPCPVNLLRVSDLREAGGCWEGKVSGQRLGLPAGPPGGGDSACVRIRPQDVALEEAETTGGAGGRLRGVVREVVASAGRVFVAVDVGQFLWAEAEPEAVRRLGLVAGKSVSCRIEAGAVRFVV